MDKKLRAYLFELYYESKHENKGITHLEIAEIEEQRGKACYKSGRQIKFNDIIITVLIVDSFNKNGIKLETIYLHVDEIDEFCKNYSMFILGIPTDDKLESRIRIIIKNEHIEEMKKYHLIKKWTYDKKRKNLNC